MKMRRLPEGKESKPRHIERILSVSIAPSVILSRSFIDSQSLSYLVRTRKRFPFPNPPLEYSGAHLKNWVPGTSLSREVSDSSDGKMRLALVIVTLGTKDGPILFGMSGLPSIQDSKCRKMGLRPIHLFHPPQRLPDRPPVNPEAASYLQLG